MDKEALRKCIESGQVSADQLVAHHQSGDYVPRTMQAVAPGTQAPVPDELVRLAGREEGVMRMKWSAITRHLSYKGFALLVGGGIIAAEIEKTPDGWRVQCGLPHAVFDVVLPKDEADVKGFVEGHVREWFERAAA